MRPWLNPDVIECRAGIGQGAMNGVIKFRADINQGAINGAPTGMDIIECGMNPVGGAFMRPWLNPGDG